MKMIWNQIVVFVRFYCLPQFVYTVTPAASQFQQQNWVAVTETLDSLQRLKGLYHLVLYGKKLQLPL